MNRGIDEKQANLNRLTAQLYKYHYTEVAQKLEKINLNARKKILSYFKELPRCVFQGDLNPSNLCIDKQGHFKGIIDFNMSGTEVNINCFLNESMYYIKERDFETLSSLEIHRKMENIQNILLKEIFK